MSSWGNLGDLCLGDMKSNGDTFYEGKVVIDDVMWRPKWRLSEDLIGLVEEDIGSREV